jgi:beta-galactosidase
MEQSMSQLTNSETPASRLWLGAVYRPEHWPEERWPEDVRLMIEAGLNVVRMADCSWASLEPFAGEFVFGWLDGVIALLGDAGISTVLGTPTSTLPEWLLRQHPDLLAEDPPGQRGYVEGSHRYCSNSPELRAAVGQLVATMAEHFGPNPCVLGWQIDNPCRPTCYCPRCQAGFRRYLNERYGSLEELNLRWRASCQGLTYSDWEQIPLPLGHNNPQLLLDFKRFMSHSYRQFQKLQIDLLRPRLRAGVWIAAGPAGWEGDLDLYSLAEDPDLASTDFCTGKGKHDYRSTSVARTLARGLKRRTFWISDTHLSNADYPRPVRTLHKDETHALVWQAVGQGADGVVAWRWRPAPNGEEQLHGTLVDQSGQPRPFFDEVKLLGLEFNALTTWLCDTTPLRARVAILNSCDSRWALEGERQQTGFDYVEHLEHWHRPLATRHVAVDIVPPDANLDQYKLVIAPALSVLSDTIVGHLRELVRHSGHLVLTLKTGIWDEHHALVPQRQPGPLSTLAGVEVEDYFPLDEPVPVKGNWFEGVGRHWAERLRILDANKAVKIARYGASNGWLDDEIAITVCAQGTGLAYMVGTYLDVAAQQAMVDHFLQNAGMQKIETPPGVEISVRAKPDGQQLYVVVNHERSPATVALPFPALNPLTEQPVIGAFRLAPHGVAVLLKSQQPQLPSAK